MTRLPGSSQYHHHQMPSQPNASRIEYFYDTHDALTPMPPWTERDVQLFGPLPPALTERENLIAARWLVDSERMEWTRPTPYDDPEGILPGRARELGLPVYGLEEERERNKQQREHQHIQLSENQAQHNQQGLKRRREAEHDEALNTVQQPLQRQQYTHPDQMPPSMRRAWEQSQLMRAPQRMQAQDPNALQIKLTATPPPYASPMATPQIKSASSPLNATPLPGSPLINNMAYPTSITMSSPLRRPTYAAYPQRASGHPHATAQLPHVINNFSAAPPLHLAQPQPQHVFDYQQQPILSQPRMRTPSSSLDVKPVFQSVDIKPVVVSSPNARYSSPATTMSSTRSTPNMQAMQPKQEELGAIFAEGPARKKRRMSETSLGLMAVPTYVQQSIPVPLPEQAVYMHAQMQAQAHAVAYNGMSSAQTRYYLPS